MLNLTVKWDEIRLNAILHFYNSLDDASVIFNIPIQYIDLTDTLLLQRKNNTKYLYLFKNT